MNHADFDQVFDDQVQKCRSVLLAKSKEYSTQDKLHNFKVAAALQGCTPEVALGGMAAKHMVSIYDLLPKVKDFDSVPMAVWEEKIGDAINYLILLKGLLVEREQNQLTIEIKQGGKVLVTNVGDNEHFGVSPHTD